MGVALRLGRDPGLRRRREAEEHSRRRGSGPRRPARRVLRRRRPRLGTGRRYHEHARRARRSARRVQRDITGRALRERARSAPLRARPGEEPGRGRRDHQDHGLPGQGGSRSADDRRARSGAQSVSRDRASRRRPQQGRQGRRHRHGRLFAPARRDRERCDNECRVHRGSQRRRHRRRQRVLLAGDRLQRQRPGRGFRQGRPPNVGAPPSRRRGLRAGVVRLGDTLRDGAQHARARQARGRGAGGDLRRRGLRPRNAVRCVRPAAPRSRRQAPRRRRRAAPRARSEFPPRETARSDLPRPPMPPASRARSRAPSPSSAARTRTSRSPSIRRPGSRPRSAESRRPPIRARSARRPREAN